MTVDRVLSARERMVRAVEQTGCPELRTLHLLLGDMTDAEYDEIKARNTLIGPVLVVLDA